MTDTTRDLLVRGMAAAKAKEYKEARFYLEWLLRLEPCTEERLEAYYWLSEASQDFKERRGFLEDILANNPGDARARRALAILDGKLDPKKIVDANRLPINSIAPQSDQQRFICPSCGGKMTFTPDGTSLTCEYCASRRPLQTAGSDGIEEDDFLLALATAKGHYETYQSQTQTCQGCGARFILTPQQISSTCPYCDSAYVACADDHQEIILPNALLPFQTTEKEAQQTFNGWLAENGERYEIQKTSGKGIYVPIWTFDVGGQLRWSCELYKKDHWIPFSDSKLLLINDVKVPASKNFERFNQKFFNSFNFSELVPFDPAYLSAWLAETHDTSLAQASLLARQKTLTREKRTIEATLTGKHRDLTLYSNSMLIETYKLVLLPVWVCHYWIESERFDVYINGQNSYIHAELPATNPVNWLKNLFNNTSD